MEQSLKVGISTEFENKPTSELFIFRDKGKRMIAKTDRPGVFKRMLNTNNNVRVVLSDGVNELMRIRFTKDLKACNPNMEIRSYDIEILNEYLAELQTPEEKWRLLKAFMVIGLRGTNVLSEYENRIHEALKDKGTEGQTETQKLNDLLNLHKIGVVHMRPFNDYSSNLFVDEGEIQEWNDYYIVYEGGYNNLEMIM
jgi:hypothetical protein